MGSLWGDLKRSLLEQSNDPDSELRRRIEQTALAFGTALSNDPSLRANVDRWVEGAASYIIDAYRHEVADLIETTVAKWDADEAAQSGQRAARVERGRNRPRRQRMIERRLASTI